MFRVNKWFALVYLAWVLGFGIWDAVSLSWWAVFQLAFLPIALYWVYNSWIKDGSFGKKQTAN